MGNVDGILMVYDITNNQSFANIKHWNHDVETYKTRSDITKIVIGNKNDLETQRSVSIADAEKLCKQLNIQNFIETSALNGSNVDEAFEIIARECYTNQNLMKRREINPFCG